MAQAAFCWISKPVQPGLSCTAACTTSSPSLRYPHHSQNNGKLTAIWMLGVWFALLEIYFMVRKILEYIRGYMCFHEFGQNLEASEKWVDAGKRRGYK